MYKNGLDTNRQFDNIENINFNLKTELNINDLNQSQNFDQQSNFLNPKSNLRINLSKI